MACSRTQGRMDHLQVDRLFCSCCSARATHEARCFSKGYYLTRKVNGHMIDSKGTLPLGVKPVRILYEARIFRLIVFPVPVPLLSPSPCCSPAPTSSVPSNNHNNNNNNKTITNNNDNNMYTADFLLPPLFLPPLAPSLLHSPPPPPYLVSRNEQIPTPHLCGRLRQLPQAVKTSCSEGLRFSDLGAR